MTKQSSFDDAEAKRIIARAAEIDMQQRQSLDVNTLRDIAAEAGISPASIDKALEEHLQPPASTKAVTTRRTLVIFAAIGGSALILLASLIVGRLLVSL